MPLEINTATERSAPTPAIGRWAGVFGHGRRSDRLRRSIRLRFNRLVGGYVPVHPVVLVVDDDPDIRRSVVQALEDDGMMGIGAASGQEALRILNRDPTVGVLLTDIMMPGITGTTLADHAARLRPDLKVMFMTAYADAGDLPRNRPVLAKPFATDTLCNSVRAACAPN